MPNEKEFGHLRRDIYCEKTAIFDRMNRLIRCVIDCKTFDGDAISTRVGLELARAVSAHSWENKPNQLSQIPGFGPVMVRKWVSQGVSTVLGVADRDFLDIERISSRNPPFGRNLLKILDGFPRLTLQVEMSEWSDTNSSPQNNTTVMLKATLGHRNAKLAPNWNGKVPAVTFMVEVSDGSLAYFWRGNIKKLDPSNGLEMKFPVTLSGPDQTISCYLSCEEIVGTQVVKRLEPQIPSAVFTNTGATTQPKRHEPPRLDIWDSDVDLEEVEDTDMLDVLDSTNLDGDQVPPNEYPGPLDAMADDEFPLIDDILSQELPPTGDEPPKMENGRWMCHHSCRNGGPTKSGKPCSHKCCREGVDKPRPPPQRKHVKQFDEEDADPREHSSKRTQDQALSLPKPKSISTNHGKGTDAGGGNRTMFQPKRSKAGRPRLKRVRSLEDANGTNSSKRRAAQAKLSLQNVDCVDLTGSDDFETYNTNESNSKHTTEAEKGKRSLQELHRKSQGNTDVPGRLTKSFKNKAHDPQNSAGDYVFLSPEANIGDKFPYDGGSGSSADSFEFPDIGELIRHNESINTQSPLNADRKDESLHPGVLHTFEESMKNG